MTISEKIINLIDLNEKSKWVKLVKDVKTKEGTIPKGTMVKVLSKKNNKTKIESPDGLIGEVII